MRRKEPPTRRLETADLQLLYQEETPAPPVSGGVRDAQVVIDHPLLTARSRILTLDGLTVIRGSTTARQDIELTSREAPSPVMLSYYLQGRVSGSWRASGLDIESRPGMHGIAFAPEPGFTFRLPRDVRHEVFEVNISWEHLQHLAGRYPEMIERLLSPVLSGRPFAAWSRSVEASPEALAIASRIMASEGHGPARRAFIEACVVELLALETRALGGDPPAAPVKREPGPRALERVHHARELILARMKEPPTLTELAHLVGTNEFTLKRDFKAAFGSTVFEALFDHRMQLASRLLQETDLAVEEIADQVGYSSAAHFTTAFKRKFGFPPTALRRRLK